MLADAESLLEEDLSLDQDQDQTGEAASSEESEDADSDQKDAKAPASLNLKQQGADQKPHWYVVHTYSGHENKVKTDIETTIRNRGLQEQMFEVMVPVQEVVETTKTGKRKVSYRKIMPCYVLVNMIMNDVTWYVVRNTSGVTGFVGPGSEPVPLSDEEMRMFGVKKDDFKIDVAVGDKVRLISGAFEGTEGVIKKINGKQTVVVEARMLGERLVDVEIGLDCIKKL
ncbi:MAG: transcription termination/antitermination protein NusG [Eubacterium sp.]|nr:transcription termination/antitermination protein NusG [Eubacterium sp.]